MKQLISRTCGACLVAIMTACGAAPQAPPGGSVPGSTQHLSFTALADPAFGRFQIATQPMPVLGVIAEDSNGNPATVDQGKVQIYGPNVAFASGGVGYPSVCSAKPVAPMVMFADVEVFSGFNEQLRNVYVKITSQSLGPTFCGARPTVGTFTAQLDPNVWLYLYAPLDYGTSASSSPKRSLQWGLQLSDNGAFWFKGELWAEVIPQLPTISKPAAGAAIPTGDLTAEVVFLWALDAAANGSAPANTVPFPTNVGAQLTILRCNANSTGAYNPASCTTTFMAPTLMTSLENKVLVPTGYWYQWSLRSVFRLPGDAANTVGTLVATRNFKAGN